MTNTESKQLREDIEAILESNTTADSVDDYYEHFDADSATSNILALFHSHESQIKQDIFKKVEGLIVDEEGAKFYRDYASNRVFIRNEVKQELRASLKALEEEEA